MAATRRIQFMCRLDTSEIGVLEAIAKEQNFFGGQGVRKGEPNLSRAARFAMAKGAVEVLKPAWPIIDSHIDDEVTLHAGVLRGRIEMFIDELRGRGLGEGINIAAELEQIINETIED